MTLLSLLPAPFPVDALPTPNSVVTRALPQGIPGLRNEFLERTGMFGSSLDPDATPGAPGLFGPDSVTWALVGQASQALAGLRAALLQTLSVPIPTATDSTGKFYDDFLGRPDTDAFARSLALQGKAAAQEQKGDIAGALETWKAVEGLDRAQYGLLSGVQVGRLLEGQGKGAEARTHYERLQKDFSAALDEMANRPLKVEIERRIAALAAPG